MSIPPTHILPSSVTFKDKISFQIAIWKMYERNKTLHLICCLSGVSFMLTHGSVDGLDFTENPPTVHTSFTITSFESDVTQQWHWESDILHCYVHSWWMLHVLK